MSQFGRTGLYSTHSTTLRSATIPDAPGDTVSCLTFSSSNTYLAASSWDSTLRVWQFNNWKAEPKFYTTTQQIPILRCCFDQYDQNVYFGATDGNVYSVSVEGTSSAFGSTSFSTTSSFTNTSTTTNSAFKTQTSSTASKPLFSMGTTNVDPHLKTSLSVTPTCILQYYKTLGLITGLRWVSRLNSLVVATSCVDPEKGDTYALIFYFDPTQAKTLTMDTLRNQLLLYKTNVKIIDIDVYEDTLFVCGIQSNPAAPSQTIPYISTINLASQPPQENVIPIGMNDTSHVEQQITSIAATKRGYIAANTLGDAEVMALNQNTGAPEYFMLRLFRNVASGKCALYPANCVAYNQSKDIAIICSGVNLSISPASPQISFLNTITGINMIKPFQGNTPITACAFANDEDFFVVATGNDWSKGVPKPHQTSQVGIYLQKIPEDVMNELQKNIDQQ